MSNSSTSPGSSTPKMTSSALISPPLYLLVLATFLSHLDSRNASDLAPGPTVICPNSIQNNCFWNVYLSRSPPGSTLPYGLPITRNPRSWQRMAWALTPLPDLPITHSSAVTLGSSLLLMCAGMLSSHSLCIYWSLLLRKRSTNALSPDRPWLTPPPLKQRKHHLLQGAFLDNFILNGLYILPPTPYQPPLYPCNFPLASHQPPFPLSNSLASLPLPTSFPLTHYPHLSNLPPTLASALPPKCRGWGLFSTTLWEQTYLLH